ncbi:hypothetical protein ACFL6M_04845 [Candidatus Eisenbacteria bacterium]|uniref:TIGR03016 family PEP-CTERM system-associated outer membrane protein n=1 Tax=Eiseniibacteriota bacterium TaxID=2212470 RepID=A0ABV6YKR6_UNCEI
MLRSPLPLAARYSGLFCCVIFLLLASLPALGRTQAPISTRTPSDTLYATTLDSLDLWSPAAHSSGSLIVSYGCEVEGLQQSFGGESLTSLTVATDASIEAGEPVDDQLEEFRFVEHETAPLALVELSMSSPGGGLESMLDVEAKAGEFRKALSAEGWMHGSLGGVANLSVRDFFYWDQEDAETVQNLLYVGWTPPLGGRGWRLDTRGSLDISRTEETDLDLSFYEDEPDADSVATAWLGFLNYEKVGLRLGFSRIGLRSASFAVDLSRKWVQGSSSGAYQAISLLASRGWFSTWGMLDLDAELQRRHYESRSAALGSFWEGELRGRWMREREPTRFEAGLSVTGTLYDRSRELDENEEIFLWEENRLVVEAEAMLRRALVGGTFSLDESKAVEELEIGVGPTAELLRLKHGDGDAVSAGGRLETSVRGGGRETAWWLESSVESGRRSYRNDGASDRLTVDGLSLSLSQTDYTYVELSIMGGGALPFSLEWESYLSLDKEWHTRGEDNAELLSFSLAIKHRWDLLGP